jgi:hypothetical protein
MDTPQARQGKAAGVVPVVVVARVVLVKAF